MQTLTERHVDAVAATERNVFGERTALLQISILVLLIVIIY